MPHAQHNPVIEVTGVVKRFGGVTALNGVDFSVWPGEICALLGQNGAGKSTLVKILNGVHPAGSYEGSIRLAGHTVAFRSPAQAGLSGMGYVPQESEVLEQLSVTENVFAGHMNLGRGVLIQRRRLDTKVREIFDDLGIEIDPRALVASLGAAQRHLVMIARALILKPRVLVLDEPTASLSNTEVDALFAVLARLRAQGVAMIYITHRLPEVMAICDRAAVLRDGKITAQLTRDEFDEDQFIYAMSGQRLQKLFPEHTCPVNTKTVLEVEHLCVKGSSGAVHGARDISFSLAAGEILGLAGLLGSGRSEILHGIYGREPATGTLRIDGQPVTIRAPRDALDLGIALLTEDRKRDGLLFNLPIGANITIGNLSTLATAGFVSRQRERNAIVQAMRQLSVKAASAQAFAAQLSGGNQQKLLFARVLRRAPRVLLLDEPTKGVDAATRHEIYKLVVDLANQGVALVLVSSELDEVLGLADRCLTISDGRIIDEFRRGEGGEDRILRAVAAAQTEMRRAA